MRLLLVAKKIKYQIKLRGMKKYIFFASCIKDMGGAQMYLRNKCLYLQTQGWDVSLVSAQKGKVYISELKKYDWFIPELAFDYYLFSRKRRELIVNEITSRFIQKEYDDIVIESTCISECTWGEVVAEKTRARHLCFLLQEDNTVNSPTDRQFLKFKYERHELAGIVQQSLQNLFASFSPIIAEKSYYLPAYCNNVVEDVDCDILNRIDIQCVDHIIGCLSRLDKPFIIPAFKDFINYAQRHRDKKYLLLLIGGAPKGSSYEKNINIMFKEVENVKLLITGYMYPVPSSLLDKCDAFFTSAGSSWVCKRSGVPTISYDANDLHPIGIMGRTTDNGIMRGDNEPVVELTQLLDEILEEKKYQKQPPSYELSKPDFSSHDTFLKGMSSNKEYFSFENTVLTKEENKLAILLKLCGAERYYNLGALKRRVLKRSSSDR